MLIILVAFVTQFFTLWFGKIYLPGFSEHVLGRIPLVDTSHILSKQFDIV